MSRFCDRPLLRLTTIGAIAAALALAGCGRKGALDPPPGAASGNQATVGSQQVMGSKGNPRAPIGPDKHIPLDNLLN